MTPKLVIEIALCLLLVGASGAIIYARLFVRHKFSRQDGSISEIPKGIGSRLIQLVSIFVIIPVVALLALEGCLSSDLTGTLLGSIIGYTLGSLGRHKDEPHAKEN
jgi:hypothetical protein